MEIPVKEFTVNMSKMSRVFLDVDGIKSNPMTAFLRMRVRETDREREE